VADGTPATGPRAAPADAKSPGPYRDLGEDGRRHGAVPLVWSRITMAVMAAGRQDEPGEVETYTPLM
jgi:hypothetical protein